MLQKFRREGLAYVTCLQKYLCSVQKFCLHRETSLKLISNKHSERHINNTKYRVSQEECARLREGVSYVKVYRYNPKHLCPMLNSYGDNGQRKVWSTHCTCQLTILSMSVLECGVILRQFSSRSL